MTTLDLELCELSYKLTLDDYIISIFNKIFSEELNEDYLKPIIKNIQKEINNCLLYGIDCFKYNYEDLIFVYGQPLSRTLNYKDINDHKEYVKLFK